MTIEDCRRFYAEEIRFSANIASEALVEALARVPRERFLGPGPWRIASAEQRALSIAGMARLSYTPVEDARHVYHNVVVVLDEARDINNGQPGALARWIDALELKPGDRAYHLGCGVGYYTALMAEVVGAAGSVIAAEIETDLAERARRNLAGYPQATVHAGDGATYDPGACDAMLINAGVTHPHAVWLDRLRDGGRLVMPLTITATPKIGQGVMVRITRTGAAFTAEILTAVAIYSGAGLRSAEAEAALKQSLMNRALLGVKSVRREPHEPGETCLVHTADACLSSLPA